MHRANNFDMLRLVFATIVVFAHCHDLSLQPALWWIPHVFSSRLAIEGFFVMSGYLIVGSYDHSPTLSSYLTRRAKRILPAYWESLAFCLILGTILSSLSFAEFWRSHQTWKFIFANLSFANFLHPSLPGLFTDNPQSGVNGALWTIKIEIMFYLLVPAIVVFCRKLGRWQMLSAIFLASVIFRVACERSRHMTLAVQLPGQLCFFAFGALVYYYFSWFYQHGRWMWGTAILAYLAYLATDAFALRALGVPLLVLCFAFLFPRIQGPTRYGDFSYGIYVFHFPIVQTLIAIGLFKSHPELSVGSVCILVIVIAVASWNLVERPALGRPTPKPQIAVSVAATHAS